MRSASKKRCIVLVLLVLVLYGCGYGSWKETEQEVVTREPVQDNAVAKQSFKFKDFVVHVEAGFDIEARVLSSRRYFFGREVKLAPVDLALGWQQMSDRTVLDKMKIYQYGRWYFYRYDAPPISPKEIVNHSANMHLIPATKELERKIKKARRGNIVRFKGFLANLTADDGWYWNSSKSRADTGDGSCEVVFVEEFELIE